MSQKADELSRRIAVFSVAVLRAIQRLPGNVATDTVIRQVARAAAGTSANYRSARLARSRAEFVSKLAVAVEEADETAHWLWMAAELRLAPSTTLAPLSSEAKEIRAILSASLSTARRNLKREAAGSRDR